MQFLLFSGSYNPREYLKHVYVKSSMNADVQRRPVIYKKLGILVASALSIFFIAVLDVKYKYP